MDEHIASHSAPSVHWVQSFEGENMLPSALLLLGHDGKSATWLTYGAALRLALSIVLAPLSMAWARFANRWL